MISESQMRGFVSESLQNVPVNPMDFTAFWYEHIKEEDELGNPLWVKSIAEALPILNHTLSCAYLVSRWGGEGMGAMREEGVIALYKFICLNEELFSIDAAYKHFREEITSS